MENKLEELEELFVPYTESLELRKLGFDKLCLGFYVGKDRLVHLLNDGIVKQTDYSLDSRTCFRAPTYSQTFKFFRDNFKLESKVEKDDVGEYYGFIPDKRQWDGWIPITIGHPTYEKAELDLVRQLILKVNEK